MLMKSLVYICQTVCKHLITENTLRVYLLLTITFIVTAIETHILWKLLTINVITKVSIGNLTYIKQRIVINSSSDVRIYVPIHVRPMNSKMLGLLYESEDPWVAGYMHMYVCLVGLK